MTQAISTYQMQILDCISQVKDEEELKEIRNLLADYFSKKALDAMDLLCEKGRWILQLLKIGQENI